MGDHGALGPLTEEEKAHRKLIMERDHGDDRASKNRRDIQRRRLYPQSYSISEDTRRILKRRSFNKVEGMSASAVLDRMVLRYDELIDRCTPAMTFTEWGLLRQGLGRGPFPNVLINALDLQVADLLRRHPKMATMRGIDIQTFLERVRRWNFAERLAVIDALERPVESRTGTPVPYTDIVRSTK